jgi:hypothetical protein
VLRDRVARPCCATVLRDGVGCCVADVSSNGTRENFYHNQRPMKMFHLAISSST